MEDKKMKEPDQNSPKRARIEDYDESLGYIDQVPIELLCLIVNHEKLICNGISDDADKAIAAFGTYNILRAVNKIFRGILPDILTLPLLMSRLPLVKRLFLKAAKNGDLRLLQLLLDNDFTCVKKRLSKSKGWIESAKRTDVKYMNEIVPKGFSLNASNYEDWLISAIGYGKIPFCEKLIQEGLFNEVENARLIHAIILQDKNQVEALIKNGHGTGMLFGKYTETMVAAACGNIEIFKLFSPYERNIYGQGDIIFSTSLRCAARNGHIKIMWLLLGLKNNYRKFSYNYDEDWDKSDALAEAAAEDQMGAVAILLLKQANINCETSFGTNGTALGNACKNGHREMVALLLDQDADPNIELGFGLKKSALRLACRYGDVEIVKLLINKGADVNGDTYWSALMVAVCKGDLEIAKLLVEHGADIYFKTEDGHTLLGQATSLGHIEIVKWLVSQNVDINLVDQDGDTPTNYALINGDTEMLKFLRAHGGRETDNLKIICSIGNIIMIIVKLY